MSKTKPAEDSSADAPPVDVPEPLHGSEPHNLTARQQLMRQWPSQPWELRDDNPSGD